MSEKWVNVYRLKSRCLSRHDAKAWLLWEWADCLRVWHRWCSRIDCQVCWRTSCLRTSCDDYDRIITVTSIVITLCQEITYKRSFTINRLLRSSSTFCLVSHSLFSCASRHSIQCRRRLFSSLYRSSDMSPNAKNEALVPPTPVTHVIFDMDGLLIGMYLLTHNSFCSNLIVSEPSL